MNYAAAGKHYGSLLKAVRYCICTPYCSTVRMTLKEFASLTKEDQVNVIKMSGTFLFIRQEAGIDIVLYQIKSFYAEVYFEGENKKNFRIRSFDDTGMLDIYLKEISLTELQHLL